GGHITMAQILELDAGKLITSEGSQAHNLFRPTLLPGRHLVGITLERIADGDARPAARSEPPSAERPPLGLGPGVERLAPGNAPDAHLRTPPLASLDEGRHTLSRVQIWCKIFWECATRRDMMQQSEPIIASKDGG